MNEMDRAPSHIRTTGHHNTPHTQVDDVEKREEQLQRSYVELLDERDRLHALVYGTTEGDGCAMAGDLEG